MLLIPSRGPGTCAGRTAREGEDPRPEATPRTPRLLAPALLALPESFRADGPYASVEDGSWLYGFLARVGRGTSLLPRPFGPSLARPRPVLSRVRAMSSQPPPSAN